MLNLIGVVSLDEASIPRLVSALHELAERKEQEEPEALRHFNALVHDLYEAIQVKVKAEPSADALKPLLDHPVLLLRGEQLESVINEGIRPVWAKSLVGLAPNTCIAQRPGKEQQRRRQH